MGLDLSGLGNLINLETAMALFDKGKRAWLASVFRGATMEAPVMEEVAAAMYNDEYAGNLTWANLPPEQRTVWIRRAKSSVMAVAEIIGK